MIRLRLTVEARLDLDDIQDRGLLDFAVIDVRNHMAGFDRIFALLRDRPEAGQLQPRFGKDIRSFSHRPHHLLYRVDRDTVLIIRILHQRRDVRRALRGKS